MNSPHGRPTKWREQINCGCKINLRLKVTGRREDGLHDLSSCFLFLEHPGDLLTIESAGEGIKLETPGFPELAGSDNLVWRAAELFVRRRGIVPSWRIILEKKVPLAAGLGGGSADAAGVLSLLAKQYPGLEETELGRIAFELGADVPFFLARKAAWVSGAGENIRIMEVLPPLPEILIVNPAFPVSAKWAYTRMDRRLIGADDPEHIADFMAGCCDWRSFCRNDLAPAVMEKFPLTAMLAEFLDDSGALAVQISGSGPSIFALFESGAAEKAAELRRRFAGLENMRIFTGGREF